MALWEPSLGQSRGGSEGTVRRGQGGWWAQGLTRGLTETQADQQCQKGQRPRPRKGQRQKNSPAEKQGQEHKDTQNLRHPD